MEKRTLKVSFVRSGAGSITPRLILPKKYTDLMEVTTDNREVELIFDEEKKILIISKKQ